MMPVFRSHPGALFAIVGLWVLGACSSMGTNTGNGSNPGTGGLYGFQVGAGGQGAGGTGYWAAATGGAPNCVFNPCEEPVLAYAPDNLTFRGRVTQEIQVAGSPALSDARDPALLSLVFSGWRVDDSDAGCAALDSPSNLPEIIRMCIPSAGIWVDGSGTLHVHNVAGAGCMGAYSTEPWGLDMTLTANGMLKADLFHRGTEPSANTPAPDYSITGQIDGYTAIAANGENQPLSIAVGDGGTFTFPATPIRSTSCIR